MHLLRGLHGKIKSTVKNGKLGEFINGEFTKNKKESRLLVSNNLLLSYIIRKSYYFEIKNLPENDQTVIKLTI